MLESARKAFSEGRIERLIMEWEPTRFAKYSLRTQLRVEISSLKMFHCETSFGKGLTVKTQIHPYNAQCG